MLRWIGVGLWVLAACAGRSTKSMGFHQTPRTLQGLAPSQGGAEGRGRAGHGAKARGQEAKGARGLFGFGCLFLCCWKMAGSPLGPAHVPAWGCLTAVRQLAGRRDYSPRLPGGFTLPHRADGGSAGASSAHANGQRRSWQFRV